MIGVFDCVVVISPQPWNTQFVSKHHYALELSKKYQTYFVNPPEFYFGFPEIIDQKIAPNLVLVNIKLPISGKINKFILGTYQFVCKRFLLRFLKSKGKTKLLIDFGFHKYIDSLKYFKAEQKIYFPVDNTTDIKIEDRGADVFFSLSPYLVEQFNNKGLPMQFIHHGLSEDFVGQDKPFLENKKFKIGLSGNLDLDCLDVENIIRTINFLDEKIVEFHFYGQCDNRIDFLIFLKSKKNVIIHNVLNSKELASELNSMNALWLCYIETERYKLDNSHKMMEYLSTGLPIISTKLSSRIYENLDINFLDNKNHYLIFEKIRKQKTSIFQNNIQFALNNTYKMNLDKILKLI